MSADSAKITPVNVGKKSKRNQPALVRTKTVKSNSEEDSSASVDEGYILYSF